jgi:hypothetical protein
MSVPTGHVTPDCDSDGCYCPDDVFWGRLLGDNDPCAPGKDWAAAAFGTLDDEDGAR